MMRPKDPPPFNLVIRQSDGKCRGERYGQPVSGWCRDAMAVIDSVRRKECAR